MEERLFEKHRFYLAIAQSLIIIGLIWLAFILNHVFMLNWNDFGVRPRELSGLVGIFTLPFLHADFPTAYRYSSCYSVFSISSATKRFSYSSCTT